MRSHRRVGTRVCAVLIGVAAATVPLPAAAAEQDLEAAQRRADQAARELSAAQEELAEAQDAVTHVKSRVSAIDARTSATRDQVRQVAIRLYVEGTGQLTRLLRMADANQIVRAQQFAHVVAGTSTDSLRQYRADREDLEEEQEALQREEESLESAIGDLRRRQVAAMAEIERLAEVARRAQAERERQEQAQRAAAATSAPPAAPAQAAGGAPAITSPSGLGQLAASPTAPPRTNAPATTQPAAASAAPAAASGDWICPVQGPLAFSDDYGAPRGGGSSHQGNDMLAPRGTPVVASVSGTVTQRNGAVSGLAYFLAGDDGNRYFGAHLDSLGASGRVSAGTVVGTVGNTGDAAGGPTHLHFEIHPGGNGNVNPYPTLRKYC